MCSSTNTTQTITIECLNGFGSDGNSYTVLHDGVKYDVLHDSAEQSVSAFLWPADPDADDAWDDPEPASDEVETIILDAFTSIGHPWYINEEDLPLVVQTATQPDAVTFLQPQGNRYPVSLLWRHEDGPTVETVYAYTFEDEKAITVHTDENVDPTQLATVSPDIAQLVKTALRRLHRLDPTTYTFPVPFVPRPDLLPQE